MSDIVQRIALKAVIVDHKGKVLLLREALTNADGTITGKYTTPGGRLEPGEIWQQGLEREVKEETGLVVAPVRPLQIAEWRPTIHGTPHQIVAIYILCKYRGGEVTLNNEHDAFVWVNTATWQKYDVAESVKDLLKSLLSET